MSSEFCNFVVMALILAWSLIIFFTKPATIYEGNNSFKVKTFNFWLAFWFAAFLFYLVHYLAGSGSGTQDLGSKKSLLQLAITLASTDVNSILMLGVYSSYTRAKDFSMDKFIRTWIPLWGVFAIYEFLWVVIGTEFNMTIQPETTRFLMLTPSLGIAMLAAYCLGWGFHRRLGRGAIIFPIVSAPWALIQMPLYYFFLVKGDKTVGAQFIWGLIFLKIFVAVMFFTYIMFPAKSQESVIRESENIPFPKPIKRVVKWLLSIASGLLALIKIVEWIKDALK